MPYRNNSPPPPQQRRSLRRWYHEEIKEPISEVLIAIGSQMLTVSSSVLESQHEIQGMIQQAWHDSQSDDHDNKTN